MNATTPDLYPTLYDYTLSIANLLVAFNGAAEMRSRDYTSVVASTAPVHLVGTWGYIAEDLVISLFGPNQFNVYFTSTTAAAVPPDFYECQASRDPLYQGVFPAVLSRTIFPNETVTFDRSLVPYAYETEYEWAVRGLVRGGVYYARCRTHVVEFGFGPWTPTIPEFIEIESYVARGRGCAVY